MNQENRETLERIAEAVQNVADPEKREKILNDLEMIAVGAVLATCGGI